MLRIDSSRFGPNRVELRISGRLTDDGTTHLAGAVASHVESARSVHLDLARLTALDHEGVGLLLRLARTGVRLANCPAFLTLWLRAEHRSRIREPSRIRDHESSRPHHCGADHNTFRAFRDWHRS